MRIALSGRRVCLAGTRTSVAEAIASALRANGGTVSFGEADEADVLVLAHTLQAGGAPADDAGLHALAERTGEAMMRRGEGRIVFVLSALGAVPARRFPDVSALAATALARVRGLAMRLGPAVLVNAIGCGAIAEPDGTLLSGDASMLSHVPTGQPGAIDDIVHGVLFLCDPMNTYMTGQMLTIDGGWSAGYGRNF